MPPILSMDKVTENMNKVNFKWSPEITDTHVPIVYNAQGLTDNIQVGGEF